MSSKRKISIFGATGSIGQSTADVIMANQDQFCVECVSAHNNVELLAQTALRLSAREAIIANVQKRDALEALLKGTNIIVRAGSDAIDSAAGGDYDLMVAGIMGFAGLRPILNAVNSGIDVAIANKEPLVAAGDMIMTLAAKTGSKILPVDSEHNAVFQVFEKHNVAAIEKIILTASGGPFLHRSVDDVYNATVAQALKHPNWAMGRKISIDSATMMNKALEIIEAKYLFGLDRHKIDVVIHPQSTIHSMVSYVDGSVLCQMGASDMRTPIASALGWPNRIQSGGEKLDIQKMSCLEFLTPDFERFPALSLAYEALGLGQGACIALNAANEVAVDLFLSEKIKFGQIIELNRHALDVIYPKVCDYSLNSLEDIEKLDNTVRQLILDYIQ